MFIENFAHTSLQHTKSHSACLATHTQTMTTDNFDSVYNNNAINYDNLFPSTRNKRKHITFTVKALSTQSNCAIVSSVKCEKLMLNAISMSL